MLVRVRVREKLSKPPGQSGVDEAAEWEN